jgi:hypothetical protein
MAKSSGYEVVSASLTSANPVQIDAPSGKFVVSAYFDNISFFGDNDPHFVGPNAFKIVRDADNNITGVVFPNWTDGNGHIVCVDA